MADFSGFPYVIVGAGFFGSTIAERIAADMQQRVLVLEARGHLGGASYSAIDLATGIEAHVYGSHIFHTRNRAVWEYVNQFSPFNSYRHTVLTRWHDQVFPMPINLDTIGRFYGKAMTPDGAIALLASEAAKEGIISPKNCEEKAISLIGRPLYEAFIRGYTAKQWGRPPSALPEGIISRLPVRTNYNVQYFDDPYQGIPTLGYGNLFTAMLANPLIEVRCNTDFFQVRDQIPATSTLIFSGAIDRLFNYRFGELSWRSLRFEQETHPVNDFQGCAVMNYAEETIPFTRIHEFKHYHPERQHRDNVTLICKEYPAAFTKGNDPFYPVNTKDDRRRMAQYSEAARGVPNLIIGGRLGSYRYYNMDQVISEALNTYEHTIKLRGV